MIRVLLVDDHAVVREGLRLYLDLQDGIEVAGEAADGEEAVTAARELGPDVVLMDLQMPKMSGVEATLAIGESVPDARVLVLTSFLEDETVRSVLRAGAAGYLLKDARPAEVADAIRTVHRGDPLLHPDVLKRVLRDVAADGGTAAAQAGSPTGTVTIMFTDIENSAPLIRDHGDEGALPIFREHDIIVRGPLAHHGGREVQHLGDGFMTAFAGARPAVACAIDVQRAFAERDDLPIRVRIGIHTGEVISEQHGYFGETVWLASRILSKAGGGQILVSDLTRQLVSSSCPCLDRGMFELKGFPDTQRLYEVEWATVEAKPDP